MILISGASMRDIYGNGRTYIHRRLYIGEHLQLIADRDSYSYS